MARWSILMLAVAFAGCGAAAEPDPGELLFVGDSNVQYASDEIEAVVPGAVVVAKVGVGVRDPFFADLGGDQVTVVNLGLNDTARSGEPYAAALDVFMARLSGPVWWTNLPCRIVLAEQRAGCGRVNAALVAAEARWPNLTVLDWSAVAQPNHLGPDGIHYSPAGREAWVRFVVGYLNADPSLDDQR